MSKDRPVIAIIDEDVMYLELLCDFLADEGYATLCCRYGHEVQHMIRTERPDLVILDVRLEQPASGWVVFDLLRRVPATKDIPVILCSADSMFLREMKHELRMQPYDLLEKPFDLDILLEKVRVALTPLSAASSGGA
jgi:DNA-binding response OmpR family regulator